MNCRNPLSRLRIVFDEIIINLLLEAEQNFPFVHFSVKIGFHFIHFSFKLNDHKSKIRFLRNAQVFHELLQLFTNSF